MKYKSIETYLFKKERMGLLYPEYDGFSFYNAVHTILDLFGIQKRKEGLSVSDFSNRKVKKVILFLVDGFGYDQYAKYRKTYDLFDAFDKKGLSFPITSVFPSTTAASLTTLATGLTPQEHGLFEWNLYIPELDEIIQTLPFSPIGRTAIPESLQEEGVSADILINTECVSEILHKKGISFYVFSHYTIANSTYSSVASKGAIRITYNHLSDLITQLKKHLAQEKGSAFFYVYWGDIDSQGHRFGPQGNEYAIESMLFFDALWKGFIKTIKKENAKNTLILLTADHGQVAVDPRLTQYLNKDAVFMHFLKKSSKGKTIPPWGGPRDVFMSVRDTMKKKAYQYLVKTYGASVHILDVQKEIQKKLFGVGKPSNRFLKRCGDFLILPKGNGTIWYEHVKGELFDLYGHHGGLSINEMLIPFCMAELPYLL